MIHHDLAINRDIEIHVSIGANLNSTLITALVLVPTHELCMQVYENLQKLLHRFHWIVPGYIMGGENRSKEKARLRKGNNFFITYFIKILKRSKYFLFSFQQL